MSNDLISRSELKEIAGKYKDEIFTYDEILELIDLAPAAISDSVYEAYCAMNDTELENTVSLEITTPKGKTVRFVKENPVFKCEKCDYRKFSENLIDGFVEIMQKNGIKDIEELSRILRGYEHDSE